jgi:hypothetical protein
VFTVCRHDTPFHRKPSSCRELGHGRARAGSSLARDERVDQTVWKASDNPKASGNVTGAEALMQPSLLLLRTRQELVGVSSISPHGKGSSSEVPAVGVRSFARCLGQGRRAGAPPRPPTASEAHARPEDPRSGHCETASHGEYRSCEICEKLKKSRKLLDIDQTGS